MRSWIPRVCFCVPPLLALAGCSDDVVVTSTPPNQCAKFDAPIALWTAARTRVDLLLAIDNSRSMADKQAILALAVPDLVKGLVNPPCVDADGKPSPNQPASPTDVCPDAGSMRRYAPITDVHIGVITSSIGGHGADSCPNADPVSKECSPLPNYTNNDHGQLIAREDACSQASLPTYEDKGFLAWDPLAELTPPGEATIDDGNGKGLVPALRDMVIGAGQIGCGYESQLESIYRFLVEPDPYEAIDIVSGKATPSGVDEVLLAQRKAFLRPDSLLAIVMLTDENDCSIKEYGQFYYVGQLRNGATNVRMPRARAICEVDPNNECCKSCGQSDGTCPHDPTCDNPSGGPALLSATEDDINLRCFDQKRRFGIDFLYPTDRYVDAFTQEEIADRAGNLVPNPIFSDLLFENHRVRDPSFVLFAGVVGVPWQDIANDPTDGRKGFKDATALNSDLGSGVTTWDVILGNPAANVPPLDPLMRESIAPRSGTNPVTGDPLVDAASPVQNPINGHEWTIDNDDLQYACIFPVLPGTERDCTNSNLTGCDCFAASNDNPLCAPDPNNMNAPTKQVKAKAYPGLRQLRVLKDLGAQGIVSSVCPPQVNDPSAGATDFGYRSAVNAVLERLTPVVDGDGGCLSRSAPTDAATGAALCAIVEVFASKNGACQCDPAMGRAPVAEERKCLAENILEGNAPQSAGWDCACEIRQLEGAEGEACREDPSDAPIVDGQAVNGYCYVDAMVSPPVGGPAVVAQCPEDMKRTFHFVGKGAPRPDSGTAIVCADGKFY